MSGGLLGQNNPYQPMMQGNQPQQSQQPQQQQPQLGNQQYQQQFQQPMPNMPQTLPNQSDQPTQQQIASYQQKQQATQEYDVRNHMMMFLKSKEGQEVVNAFSKNPEFSDHMHHLVYNDPNADQESND